MKHKKKPLALALALALSSVPALAVEIMVSDAGVPASGARVSTPHGSATTDARGVALLPQLPPGRHVIEVIMRDGQHFQETVQVDGQAPLTVTAPVTAPVTLAPVTVSASALSLSSSDMTTPVTVLDGQALMARRSATLGETLSSEPGITSTHFGGGASRPIIRGQDAARIKVLSDGSEIQDASSISPDHAVGLEPMLAERVEVLRGPSALLYGGGAVGGVVNVLDRKIPTAVPENGVEGEVEVRGNSGANEGAGAFGLTAGTGRFAIRAEGLKRDSGDYEVGRGWSGGKRVDGSYNKTETASLGMSYIGDSGFVGVSYTRQRNRYGLAGHDHSYDGCHPHGASLHCPGSDEDHEDHDHGDDHDDHDHDHVHGVPYVRMQSDRWDVRGETRNPFAGIAKIRFRAGLTNYKHDEIEDDIISTTFRNKSHDARVELEHVPVGNLRGVFGAQTSRRDFSAIGEEAYVLPTVTSNHGVFVLEEYRMGNWRFEAGLRHEWQTVTSESNQPDASHRGTSGSVGVVWSFAPQYSLGMSLSRSQRLPTAEELYANGLHLATTTYERGNANLKRETASNIDITLRKHAGPTTFALSAFHNRIGDYIYGRTTATSDRLQLIDYVQQDATFTGVEGQMRHQLTPVFGVTLFGDYVRARLDDASGNPGGNRNLPRIAPHRYGLRVDARWQAWSGQVEWIQVGRQSKVADFETETAGYGMLNVGVGYNGTFQSTGYQVYLRANNLTDRLAYRHTSFIKNAAPLMGRNIVLGMRVMF